MSHVAIQQHTGRRRRVSRRNRQRRRLRRETRRLLLQSGVITISYIEVKSIITTMNRKIILQGILLLLAFLPLCGQAKVYMIVTATNEQLTVLQLAERPVLKFADYEMMVRTADAEYTFDRRDIATVTFTDTMPDLPPIPTEITQLSSPDSQHPSTIFWQQTGDAITFHSLEPYAPVTAYTIDGQLVASARADAYGNASISTSYMPKRMLVVRAGSVAVKVTLGESRYEGKSRCEVRGARYEKSEEGGDDSHSGVISYIVPRTSKKTPTHSTSTRGRPSTSTMSTPSSVSCSSRMATRTASG